MPRQHQEESPQWLIVKAVTILILIGTLLLMLPVSSQARQWTDPLTALFMATSATCVTGHAVVDTGTYFSFFGQLVLMILVQIGGLGFMTLATVLLVVVGRRLSIQSELTLTASLGIDESNELKAMLQRTIAFTLVMEFLGALILTFRFYWAHNFTWPTALYHGLFHSVGAYCNAGLALYPDNLIRFQTDPTILLTVATLIVMGGIGFHVLYNLSRFKFWQLNRIERGRLTLHTKMVCYSTVTLLLAGWILFLALEWRRTLAPLPWVDKMTCALFQSITPRTAGFNVVDMAEVNASTRFMTMILMFIGGSPGSTAGGIKTTTTLVLIFTCIAMIRGKRETTLFSRSLSVRVIEESSGILLLSLAVLALLFGALLMSESDLILQGRFTTEALMFDTISALGTVGLSTGIMPTLTPVGKLLITVCMFIGRVGPLTVALVVGLKDTRQLVRYPEEDVMVG